MLFGFVVVASQSRRDVHQSGGHPLQSAVQFAVRSLQAREIGGSGRWRRIGTAAAGPELEQFGTRTIRRRRRRSAQFSITTVHFFFAV